MTMEQALHSESCFLTLTYDDDHLPAHGSLRKKDVQDFLKRERYHNGPLRYYGVGEYGSRTWRPHYHLALFGRNFGVRRSVEIPTWDKGHAFSGMLTPESMRYVASYLLKRLTKKEDRRLERIDPDTGEVFRLEPEFPLMSLRPGIGAAAIRAYGKFLGSAVGKKWVRENGDVPREVRIGARRFPLGRYLTDMLRDYAYLLPSLRDVLRADRIRHLSKLRASVEALDEPLQRRRAANRQLSTLRAERLLRGQERKGL